MVSFNDGASIGIQHAEDNMTPDDSERASVTLDGKVEEIIQRTPSQPEKAQIGIEKAEPLYDEIRIENALTGPNGEEVRLKDGVPVEVTVEADAKDTVPPRAEERPKRSA